MTVTQILQFPTNELSSSLNAIKKTAPKHFIQGAFISDANITQVLAEWDQAPKPIALSTSFYADLSLPALGSNGPATAPLVEYVQTYFPASKVTPGFKKQIEGDFLRFDAIYIKGCEGELGWSMGWVAEEVEHEGIKGEKTKCFLVVRGWESIANFEASVKTEEAKESLPILFGWGAPFNMWHVEKKGGDDGESTT